ncbi:MAG: hypothetical protein M1835_003417, partial [Candelina submexicana]
MPPRHINLDEENSGDERYSSNGYASDDSIPPPPSQYPPDSGSGTDFFSIHPSMLKAFRRHSNFERQTLPDRSAARFTQTAQLMALAVDVVPKNGKPSEDQ